MFLLLKEKKRKDKILLCKATEKGFPLLDEDQSSVRGERKERKCHSSDLVEASKGKNECGNWNGCCDGEWKD